MQQTDQHADPIAFVDFDKSGPSNQPNSKQPRYYVPTEAEIAAECKRIRAEWSEVEKKQRWVRR